MKRLLAAALCLTPLIAQAQERRGAAAGNFDFWVLALSWSPAWCDERGDREDEPQCRQQRRFVVHGLWPQYNRGFPAFCQTGATPLSRTAMEPALELLPSEDLARYQWRKHGTCSGLGPTAYFAAINRAAASVTLPRGFGGSDTPPPRTDAAGLIASFTEANPGLRRDMMSVVCEGGVLKEVRLCLSRTLQFQTCPQLAAQSCRQRDLGVAMP